MVPMIYRRRRVSETRK